MKKIIWDLNLYSGRNISAIWRNILPPSSTLKTEAAGPTKHWKISTIQHGVTAKNAIITAITQIQTCCKRRAILELAITCPSQPSTYYSQRK